jgi:hypothetical protein
MDRQAHEFSGTSFAYILLTANLLIPSFPGSTPNSHTPTRIGNQGQTDNIKQTNHTSSNDNNAAPNGHVSARKMTTPTQHQTATSAAPTPVPNGHVSANADTLLVKNSKVRLSPLLFQLLSTDCYLYRSNF